MDLHGRMRAPARELLVSLTSRLHCGLEERLTFFFELYDTDLDGRLDRAELMAMSSALFKLKLAFYDLPDGPPAAATPAGAAAQYTRQLYAAGGAARRSEDNALPASRAITTPAPTGTAAAAAAAADAQRHHANTASGRAAAPRQLRRRSLDISGRASLSPQHVESTRSPTPDAVGPPLRRLATVCGGDRFELIQRQAADFLQLLFVLDIDGDGALSYREWAQGVLSQPELLRCFVLAAPAAPPAATKARRPPRPNATTVSGIGGGGGGASVQRRLMLRGLADFVLCCGAT